MEDASGEGCLNERCLQWRMGASSGGWVPPVKGVSIASKEIEATLGLQLWL